MKEKMNIEHLPRRARARRVERPTSNIEWKKMKEEMNIERPTSWRG